MRNSINRFFIVVCVTIISLSISSCKPDDGNDLRTGVFTVTIENIIDHHDYFMEGLTGMISPGQSVQITFHAGQNHRLSFASMFIESNDIFFATSKYGMPLFDEVGLPITGNVTNQFFLWDAGTEINEIPGEGENQPPRQLANNTGTNENSVILPLSMIDDGFLYPSVEEAISAFLFYEGDNKFSLIINNISGSSYVPTPLGPGIYLVHSENFTPLYSEESVASMPLESLIEDGNNSDLNDLLKPLSGFSTNFSPGAYSTDYAIFEIDKHATSPFESLAEDGDASNFPSRFDIPVGEDYASTIGSGGKYQFSVKATEGDDLSFATSLLESNDWVIGVDRLDLFPGGKALSGDITHKLLLIDAGTERDEFPGTGPNQPARQSDANSGIIEENNVVIESDDWPYLPDVKEMLKVTISFSSQ